MERGSTYTMSNAELAIVLLYPRNHTRQSAAGIKRRFCTICSSAPIVRHNEIQFIPNEAENDQDTGCPLGMAVNVEQGFLDDSKQRSLQMVGQLV